MKSLLGDSMQFSSDKSRVNHCLLLAIAMKQVMLESGQLESAPAVEYADAVLELMDFTMATLCGSLSRLDEGDRRAAPAPPPSSPTIQPIGLVRSSYVLPSAVAIGLPVHAV